MQEHAIADRYLQTAHYTACKVLTFQQSQALLTNFSSMFLVKIAIPKLQGKT